MDAPDPRESAWARNLLARPRFQLAAIASMWDSPCSLKAYLRWLQLQMWVFINKRKCFGKANVNVNFDQLTKTYGFHMRLVWPQIACYVGLFETIVEYVASMPKHVVMSEMLAILICGC